LPSSNLHHTRVSHKNTQTIIKQHRFKHSHQPNILVFYKENPMSRTNYYEMGEKTEALSTNAIKPV